jgi:hypothetical protein
MGGSSPRILIRVRGRVFGNYAKTTDRTGLMVWVVIVVVVLARPDAKPPVPGIGRFDWNEWASGCMGDNKTASPVGLSSAAPHQPQSLATVASATVSAVT